MDYIFPSSKNYTIYTKSGCKYCSLVKELLKDEETTIVHCDVYLVENKNNFLKYIYEITSINYNTFPMVFYNGSFLGGYTETKKWVEQQNTNFNFI